MAGKQRQYPREIRRTLETIEREQRQKHRENHRDARDPNMYVPRIPSKGPG